MLVVGHVDPKSVHIAGDYLELFDALLAPLGIDLVPYALDEGRFPDSLAECDGWICSPSRLSTYDDVPWLADAEELHRAIVAEEQKYVGICFGHQLLAQALGGKVDRARRVGCGVSSTTSPSRCAAWIHPTLGVAREPQDQVVDVPPDAHRARHERLCPVAGLAVGERA